MSAGVPRPSAPAPGGAPNPLAAVARRRLLAGAGIAVHAAAAHGGRAPPHLVPPTTRDRAPGPSLDRPRVVPEALVHVAEVADRHPVGVEARVAIGAEGRVLAQRAVGVQGDAGPSLEAPTRGASFGPRDRVAHRIGEAEIEALAVRCV